jgi:hypothetical protein
MKTPSQATLRKYGLSKDEWLEIWYSQNEMCPICSRSYAPLVIDHEHVRNWKKMKPEKRKLYVRGLPCSWCNRWIIGRGATPQLLINGAHYLLAYQERKLK